MEGSEVTLRLNPELSRKVWKLAYPIILANLSFMRISWNGQDILKALEEVDLCQAIPLW